MRVMSCLLILASCAAAEDWRGWPRMAVVRLGDGSQTLSVSRIAGRPALAIANRNQARIDIVRFDAAAKAPATPIDTREAGALNRLPLPPGLSLERIPCPAPPLDVVADDDRLLVVHGPPWRITRFVRGTDGWSDDGMQDLLDGEPERRLRVLSLPGPGRSRVLVGCANGIQTVPLESGGMPGRPEWLKPRSRGRGTTWCLADLDRDGDLDLVEAFAANTGGSGVRWQENDAGILAPAQPLHDEPVRAIAPLTGLFPLAMLGRHQHDSVALCALEDGPAGSLGRTLVAPLPAQSVVTGILLPDGPALAVAMPGEARIELLRLTPSGWRDAGSFPSPKGVKGMVSPRPGLLLLWVADQSELLASRWQDDRLGFARPWRPDDGVEAGADRAIVGLDGNERADWWFQRSGEDLLLWTWKSGAERPESLRFAAAGTKISQAHWLGGDRAVVRIGFQADAELLVADSAGPCRRVTAARLPALARLDLARLRLVAWDDDHRCARIADGAWQWLDPDLAATDQIQLAPVDDGELAEVRQIAGSVWGLATKGRGLWRFEVGPGGLLQPAARLTLGNADRLLVDRWLGPIAIGPETAWLLSDGSSRRIVPQRQAELSALGAAQPSHATRLASAAVLGAGLDLLVHDDTARRLLLFGRDASPVAAWQVWENRGPPYGGDDEGRKPAAAEPRAMVGADLDGDGRGDLALLCHDRLLLYLSAPETAR